MEIRAEIKLVQALNIVYSNGSENR